MSFAPETTTAQDAITPRMLSGLLLSLVVHGLLLSLQFGIPGLGLPARRAPSLSVQLTNPVPPPPLPINDIAEPPPAIPPVPAPASGMTVLAPVKPSKPVVQRAPQRQRQALPVPRKSTPLPAREEQPVTPRVIAQDAAPDSKFVVPLPTPEDSEQKVLDQLEAQDGTDAPSTDADGAAKAESARLAELAEAKRQEELIARQAEQAAATKKEEERVRRQQAEAQLALQQELALRQMAEAQQRRKVEEELALKQKIEEQERRQAEQLALRKQAEELALRKQAEELAARKQAEELAARKQAEELAARKQADELAARKQAEELAARKLAEAEAARKLAEAARKQAEEQAARERTAGQAPSGQPGNAASATGPGTSAGNAGSGDFVSRMRDQVRGLDILRGAPPRPQEDNSQARRRLVAGRLERDVPIRMYVESWRQKIERNGALNYAQSVRDKARTDPLVAVALRSDGSVEDVTIVVSSGRAELDESVRRIVRVNARYSAFPPNIASRYDVIVIRRVWRFDDTLTLVEEAP